jgi:DNA-binding response OmpR family regulator
MPSRVLFIEDEDEIVELMRMRLEAAGFTFTSACNGEEGLVKAQKDKPDIILLDIIMPKVDGLTVCRKLKTDGATKNIPVIMISAAGSKEMQEKCREAGAQDFIRKPFEASELLIKITDYLKKKEAQDAQKENTHRRR